MNALDTVLAAAERWKGELLKQAAVYEKLADQERARLYGNAKAGARSGKPFETGHDKIVKLFLAEHIRPLTEAIEAVKAGRS